MPRDSSVPDTRPPATSNFGTATNLKERQRDLHVTRLTYASLRAWSSEAQPAHNGHKVVTDSYRVCLRALVS